MRMRCAKVKWFHHVFRLALDGARVESGVGDCARGSRGAVEARAVAGGGGRRNCWGRGCTAEEVAGAWAGGGCDWGGACGCGGCEFEGWGAAGGWD